MRGAFYNLVTFLNSNSVQDVYWKAAMEILEHIEEVPNYNIVDMADLCYVSTATISRLCRKLNYESFIDFKSDVTNCLTSFNDNVRATYYDNQLPDVDSIEHGKEAFTNHFENIQHNMQETFETLDYGSLLKIVEMMHEAKRIIFLGNYYTQSCANQLQIELSYQRKPCIALYPLVQQKEIVDELKDGDLVIVSSISGAYYRKNPDIMKKIARSPAKKITISQTDQFGYSEYIDLKFKVGNARSSLVGKFSITYVFELLELIYHVKYEKSKY